MRVTFSTTNLLQELNFGLKHLLHVVDFLLSLLTPLLQFRLIATGQVFGCRAARKGTRQVES